MKKNIDVLVLGAGVAGLACADEILKKSKKKVLVLEKNKWVGGLAATISNNGFLYDLAPHRWFTKNEELNKWIDDLLGDELIWVKKYTPMYQFDKFFSYPIKISDVLKKISIPMQSVMLATFLFERVRSKIIKPKIVTMKDAYISRFGYGLYKWFNEEYNEKLWGEGGCETMSADFVDQRVKNLSLSTAVLNALGFGKGKVISLVDQFRFPKRGTGRISEKLAERIIKNGGEILLTEKVNNVKKLKSGYEIATDKNIYVTKKLVSSIPIDDLLRAFGNKFIEPISNEIKKLTYVNQKIVVLLANKTNLTDFTWVYVHPKKIKTFRFLEMNNWSKDMSPKGKTSLVFEYPYHPGDQVDKMTDNELVETTIKDFIKYFAPKSISSKNIIGGRTYYVPKAYPKYDLFYKEALGVIKKFVKKKLEGVILIGRSGMFHYNNMDHSIYTGLLAARNIVSDKNIYDLELVNNEAEYHEEIRK